MFILKNVLVCDKERNIYFDSAPLFVHVRTKGEDIVIIIRNNEKFLPVRMTFITSWRLVRAASDLRAV